MREFDVLLLGATGITGRLALEYLTSRCSKLGRSFAVGARRPDRVRELCEQSGVEAPPIFEVDASDRSALAAFAARGSVLINLVGPYTRGGEDVVRACVEAGTSYLDLTGEPQFIRSVDAGWHDAAQLAGVAIVQTAGFEALPADLAVEVARDTLRRRGEALATVDVQLRVLESPGGEAVSGGTARSLLEVLRHPDDPALTDVAFRIPHVGDAARVRAASGLRLWPRISSGRVVAPMIPVPFLNPPVVHRTAWLLAREEALPFVPLRYRDGVRLGDATGARGVATLVVAELLAGGQSLLIAASRLPRMPRRLLARVLGGVLPESGTGPQGPGLDDWRWELLLTGGSDSRTPVRVRVEAQGHPGYTTTSRMVSELALIMAEGAGTGRTGCITPALAAGADNAHRFVAAGMRFTVTP